MSRPMCDCGKKPVAIAGKAKGRIRYRRACSQCFRSTEYRIRSNTRRIDNMRQLKLEVMLAYGGICACCGENRLDFLTLDHINNDGSSHRATLGTSASGNKLYRYLKKNGFPTNPPLQVLCANCNLGKSTNNGICPHHSELLGGVVRITTPPKPA